MPIPKILAAIPLIALGAFIPGLRQPAIDQSATSTIGMKQEEFDRTTITIRRGAQLRFVNNSNFLHVIAPGDRARVTPTQGAPTLGNDDVRTMPRGQPFVTDPWGTPGTFQMTCTLHPEMNLDVVVEP
jgi:plastocyanin